MRIEFTYDGTSLSFADKAELEAWCDWHLERLRGIKPHHQSVSYTQIFESLRNQEKNPPDIDFRFEIPPIRESAPGRFIYEMYARGEMSAFELAVQGWSRFKNGGFQAQGLSNAEILQLVLVLIARVGSPNENSSLVKEFVEKQRATVAALNKTRDDYINFMGLKAPAEYWEEKNIEHGDLARRYFYSLMGLGVALMGGLAFAPWFVFQVLVPKVSAFGTITMGVLPVYFSIGVAVTSLSCFIWWIRVVAKLYLSERHLVSDAKERKTLITTFLALSESGRVSKENLDMVLAAIFRSASDGVVRDEGIDLSPALIASRLLSKP